MNKVKYLNDVLTPFEAEHLIKDLEPITFEEYTSTKMIKKHSLLERLNMQAVKNALAGTDDYILEYFVTYEKINDLIRELLIARHWKDKAYPLLKQQICNISSVKTYVCLYHEAVIINMLENFLFHLTACQAAGDYLIEVVEYAYQRIAKLLTDIESGKYKKFLEESVKEKSKEDILKVNEVEEMDNKLYEMELPIALSCISVIRYVSDHLNALPFPVRHHLINVKDALLVLIPMLEAKPWIKKDRNGKELLYESHRWVAKDENSAKLPKIEAQIWITVFNIFMGQETSKKYEINDFRKRNLLRLKKFMNEVLFDQIPPLQELFRAIEELHLTNVGSTLTSNPFIVEMVAEISRSLEKLNVKEISQFQLNAHFKNADLKKEYEFLSSAYSLDNVEYFMEDPTCAGCGTMASKRCSKCKSEWYCSRECQVKRWKLHKEMCAKLAEINEAEKKERKENSRNQTIDTNASSGRSSYHGELVETKKVKIEEVNTDKNNNEIKKENQTDKKEKTEKEFDELD